MVRKALQPVQIVDFEKKEVAEASASDPLDFDIVHGALSNHFVEGSSN